MDLLGITEHTLVSHAIGFTRITPFTQIRYVGAPRFGGRWIRKAVEVESIRCGSFYVNVEERDVFCDTLNEAVGQPSQPLETAGL